MNLIALKEKISSYRKWLRLGQYFVAKYLGLTKSAMSALESDLERKVELHELVKLCKLFLCTPDEILEFGKDFSKNTDVEFSGRMNVGDDLSQIDKEELKSFVIELESEQVEYNPNSLAKSNVVKIAVKELLDISEVVEAPVDVYKIATKLGIQIKFSALSKLSGAFVRGIKNSRPSGILLNSNQPEARLRFSLGHEIAHFFLNHYPDKDIGKTKLGRHTLETEKDADEFASELLVPSTFLQKELDKLSPQSLTEIEIYKLADYFIVSFQMMLNRLYYTEKYISQEQFKQYSKMKVRDIKNKIISNSNDKIEFLPEIQLNDIVGEHKIFNINKIKKDEIRLIQEMAYEQYIQQVPLEKRSTEVKDVYEKTIFWLSKLKNPPKNTFDRSVNVRETLELKGFKVFDKRDNGGCLWVIDQRGVKSTISELESKGYKFDFAKNGSRTTKKRPSWYMKA